MKINFEFPIEIRRFAKIERIRIKDIKDEILTLIDEDLLDKNYQPIKCKEIRVVVNGIHKTQKNKVFIKPIEINNEKPLRTISSDKSKDSNYSFYYLIFRVK